MSATLKDGLEVRKIYERVQWVTLYGCLKLSSCSVTLTGLARRRRLRKSWTVTKRTVYRDIASLQALKISIEGEAGVGYIMRSGFDLPPITFDTEEAEAITFGLAMINRTGDKGLKRAARSEVQKLTDSTPLSSTLFASSWGPDEPKSVDLSDIRKAIREEQKLKITNRNADGMVSERTTLPIAIAYYSEAIVLTGWYEL